MLSRWSDHRLWLPEGFLRTDGEVVIGAAHSGPVPGAGKVGVLNGNKRKTTVYYGILHVLPVSPVAQIISGGHWQNLVPDSANVILAE